MGYRPHATVRVMRTKLPIMNTITQHPSRYHTWRESGGPIGLVLCICHALFYFVTGLVIIVVALVLLLAHYFISAVSFLLNKLRTQ